MATLSPRRYDSGTSFIVALENPPNGIEPESIYQIPKA